MASGQRNERYPGKKVKKSSGKKGNQKQQGSSGGPKTLPEPGSREEEYNPGVSNNSEHGNAARDDQAAESTPSDSQKGTASEDSQETSAHAEAQQQSPEEQRYAAEFQRIAGLNKLEKSEIADPLNPFSFLVDALRQFRGWWALAVMVFIDKDFDENEFLEGAKDSFYMVMTLWSEHDFQTLSTMTSGKLLSALRKGVDDYATKGMSVTTTLAGDIKASIANWDIISNSELARYEFQDDIGFSEGAGSKVTASDSMAAEINADPRRSDFIFHFVVTVRFQCDQHIRVVNAGGQVVQELTDKRHQLWRFVRGPLVGFPVLRFSRDRPAPCWRLLDFV